MTDPSADPVLDRLHASLGGTYTIDRELGGGGMSRVFLATETALGRRVVLKTLPEDDWSPTAAERFRREIQTAAQLSHAHIVPVLSAGDAQGIPYFTMPWVDGASLRARLTQGLIPRGEAVGILRDVALALAAAHAKGVVHRDIKPENILLSAGSALVTDFGVAKALSAAAHGDAATPTLTGLGVAIGTPAYMSPEQLAADPNVDQRADLYAWGLVAYEMLSGTYPFSGLAGASLLQAQLSTSPTPLDRLSGGVSSELSTIVMRCLAKNPDDRPASANELVAALDQSGASSTSRRPAQRRWTVAAIGATAVAAMVFALWKLSMTSAPADQTMIAIAPFRVGGAASTVHYLREGLADLMTPQLQTVNAVKAVSTRQMFDQWRRTAGSMDNELSDDRAREVAQKVGAGQLILGEVVGTADRLTISAHLVRVSDGQVLVDRKASGPADSAAALSAQLTVQLLALRAGVSTDRMRSIVSTSPEAVTAFLNGERLYRRGRYADAGLAFADAWRVDSTFALVALRMYECIPWSSAGLLGTGPWFARAWAHRERLTGNDSLLLTALAGPTYPQPTTRRATVARLQRAAENGNTAELWYHSADDLVHFGELAGVSDALSKALAGFQRAEQLDSSYAPALEHQAMLLRFAGDTAGARRAMARQAALDSSGDFFILGSMIQCMWSGTRDECATGARMLVSRQPTSLPFVALMAGTDVPARDIVPDIDFADSLLSIAQHANPPLPPTAFVDVATRDIALNGGRPSRANAMRSGAPSPVDFGNDIMAALVWEGDTTVATRAVQALTKWAVTTRDSTTDVANAFPRFARALWALDRRDTVTAERIMGELRALRPPSNSPWLSATPHVYERLLGAQLAVARHANDAKARLDEVDSLLMDVSGVDRVLVRVTGNVVLANLWRAVGEPKRALAVVRRRERQLGWASYASTFVRLDASLSEELGDRESAIIALRKYVAMRKRAEPSLQKDLAEATSKLKTLEAASRGK